jgi:DHA2 family multidrug resistance protein
MYPGNPAFAERFDGLVAGLSAQGWALVDAQQRALAVLDATMMRQAAMRAYNDAWLLLLASFVCVIPAVFLLRRPGAARPAPADAH